MPSQLPMFDSLSQPRVKRETSSTYKYVVQLRNRDVPVYRHGPSQHYVGGKIMTNDQLKTYARMMLAKEGM